MKEKSMGSTGQNTGISNVSDVVIFDDREEVVL